MHRGARDRRVTFEGESALANVRLVARIEFCSVLRDDTTLLGEERNRMRMLAGLLVAGWCAVALAWGCSSGNPQKSGPCVADSECPSGLHCDAKLGCKECSFDTQC